MAFHPLKNNDNDIHKVAEFPDELTSYIGKYIETINPEIKTLAAKIIKQRHKLGLTQQEVADWAGLKQETVARLEAGKRMPRFDTLLRISNSLIMDITVSSRSKAQSVS